MQQQKFLIGLLLPAAVLAGANLSTMGCAQGVEFGQGGEDAAGGSPGTGGTVATGGTSNSGGNGAGGTSLCDVDCSTISTPDCSVAVCNDGSYQGTVGTCVVVDADDGTSCDDGMFCTVNDTCQTGVCTGGPQNDCGTQPGPCDVVTCDEAGQSCSTTPANNGDPCTPEDLCEVGGQCQNGLCVGQPNDCFFEPVDNDCHSAVCDPTTGMCESQPDAAKNGDSCTDPTDLCTVQKTCNNGTCEGGVPKDCSQLTQGCNIGICDPNGGQCVGQAVMNGDPCDDLNACTTGEICSSGMCGGGTAITQCINNDACCPMNCDETNDTDCSCNINLAPMATADSSGGGVDSTGYGPSNWNDGVDGATCESMSCTQCQGWINGGSSPSGGWMRYTWPSAVQVGSIWVDTSDCSGSASCNNNRSVGTVTVQWWNGSSWVTAGQVTGEAADFGFTFNPKVTTTQIRMFDVATACGSNPLMYEWHVWSGSGCMP